MVSGFRAAIQVVCARAVGHMLISGTKSNADAGKGAGWDWSGVTEEIVGFLRAIVMGKVKGVVIVILMKGDFRAKIGLVIGSLIVIS